MRPYREKSRFGTGLIIYVLVFLILTAVGLIFFYDWLEAYELTRPYNAANAYEDSLHENGLSENALASLTGIDRKLQTDSAIQARAKDLLSEADLVRSLAKSASDKQVYSVRAQGADIGTVTFRPTGERKFNFRAFVPAEEEYDFSGWTESVTLQVPDDYTVSVNGVALDASYRTESSVRYRTLQDYYDEYSSLPTLSAYTSGNVLGKPEIAVTDGTGKVVPADELTEERFLDTCSKEDRSRLSDFARTFVFNYVQFTADVGGGHYIYYNEVRQMITQDSPLLDRMTQSLGSFGYTTTRSCNIVDDSVNICCPFGRGVYFVDYSYTTRTVGSGDAVEDSRNVRLVVEDSAGKLLVREMTYY